MMIKWIVLSCALGYLLGSIPFALVIGKVFFQTDVRTAGSKNLGGSNAGRVLGAKAGLTVMALDVLKVITAIGLATLLPGGEAGMIASGLCAALGHCFPLFAGFKSGKAVATMYGYLFGMMLFGGYNPWIFFLPLIAFLAILYASKIVALASIGSAAAVTLYQWLSIGLGGMVCALLVFDALIIWRHRKTSAALPAIRKTRSSGCNGYIVAPQEVDCICITRTRAVAQCTALVLVSAKSI